MIDLAHEPPDPPPPEYIRALCEHERIGGQRAAARLLHTDERTMRRWVAGERAMPWAAAELLRAYATGWRKRPAV